MNLKNLQLNGMELVDPGADYSGNQVVYLDFKGANNAAYNNAPYNNQGYNNPYNNQGYNAQQQQNQGAYNQSYRPGYTTVNVTNRGQNGNRDEAVQQQVACGSQYYDGYRNRMAPRC